jgi:hypothetical protein
MMVVKWGNNGRFAIADGNGKIVDDAQGYGYTTGQKAHKAMWYRFRRERRIRCGNYRRRP